VVADQLDFEAAALLVLDHFVNINTITLRVKSELLLASLSFALGKGVDSQVVVVGLPNEAVEAIIYNFTLDENLLMGNRVNVVRGQVEDLNGVVLGLLNTVVVNNT
jgi:hypothetical protein